MVDPKCNRKDLTKLFYKGIRISMKSLKFIITLTERFL